MYVSIQLQKRLLIETVKINKFYFWKTKLGFNVLEFVLESELDNVQIFKTLLFTKDNFQVTYNWKHEKLEIIKTFWIPKIFNLLNINWK